MIHCFKPRRRAYVSIMLWYVSTVASADFDRLFDAAVQSKGRQQVSEHIIYRNWLRPDSDPARTNHDREALG
jgi:hypothetical protein